MFEIVKAGGIVMVPIILCSIVAVAIILERLWTLREQRVVPEELTDKVWHWVENRSLSDKQILALEQHSPLGRMLAAGISNRHRDRAVMIEAIEDAGRHVAHDLERYLGMLGTIAAVSPLLGLLGTVTGMIRTFKAITVAGVGNPTAMAGGIAEALITTAAGLIIAIPALMAFRYLRGRVDALVIAWKRNRSSSSRRSTATIATATRPARRRGRGRVKFTPRRSEDPELNMTSLIDVVLLLLIFFMMSTRFVDESRLADPPAGGRPRAGRAGAARQRRDRGHRRGRLPGQRPRPHQQQPGHPLGGPEPCRRGVTARCP